VTDDGTAIELLTINYLTVCDTCQQTAEAEKAHCGIHDANQENECVIESQHVVLLLVVRI
jgi:hypothetical protein